MADALKNNFTFSNPTVPTTFLLTNSINNSYYAHELRRTRSTNSF